MLALNLSRIESIHLMPIAPGFSVTSEGAALVLSGAGSAKMAAATAGEIFVGFSFDQQMQLNTAPFYEEATLGGTNVITLQYVPAATTLYVAEVAAPTVPLALIGGAPSAVQYQQANPLALNLLTFNVANVGKKYLFTYRYNLTANQAIYRGGHTIPGGPTSATLGQIGVIDRGTVFTDQWSTADNWYGTTNVLRLGANGVVTNSGAGELIPNSYVVSVPSATSPWLGIRIR